MAQRPKLKALSEEELWNYALRLLGRRPYSIAELRTKLSRRSQSATDIMQTLSKLCEYGMADDQKFSETFASFRLQNDGFGRSRVLRDLRAKRVPSPIAEKAVEKAFNTVDETELARQFLLRKYRNKKLPELLKDQKELASAYRKLRVAGFSGGVSIALLKGYAKEDADWMEPESEEDEG